MGLKSKGFLFGILTLVVIFLTINSVNAGTLCADDQIILRLSSATNAHGEVYNGAGNYPIEICYDQIFGQTYDTSANPNFRTCTGTNKVVGLSSSTNAHAEIPSLSDYSTNVCYGDLVCNARTGGCLTGENLVLSLSTNTNAHLASDSSYPVNICCTPGAQPAQCTLTDASWSVNESLAGQTVTLNVQGTNCNGLEASFVVKEYDSGIFAADDNVNIEPQNAYFDATGASTTWTAEWPDTGGEETPEYYFEATLVSTGDTIKSGETDPLLLHVYNETPINWCQDNSITTCSDYPSRDYCESDGDWCQVASNSVPSNINCDDPNTLCACYWNETTSSCGPSWNASSSGNGIGTCQYTEVGTGDTCEDDGQLTVNLIARWIWDEINNPSHSDPQGFQALCSDTTITAACPAQIELPFFGVYNLIAAIVIIALIYWAVEMSNKKRKRRKK